VLSFDVRKKPGETVTVRLAGELAGEDWTERLLEFLEEHYVNDGVRTIVLDVGGLEFIDLEGVATLLTLLKKSDQWGKTLVVTGATGFVRQKLSTTGVLAPLEGP
jgi:anti-anti-sigma factor